MKYLTILSICSVIFLTACTATENLQQYESQTTNSSTSPESTISTTPTDRPTNTPTATASAILGATTSPIPTQTSQSNSSNSSSSSTSINVNSNNSSVKVVNKNGERYVEVNGVRKELDANGCYDYEDGQTKIHNCVNQ